MKTDKVLVKESKLHGRGVFALKDFKKGEIVLHYDVSHKISEKDVKKMNDKEKEYIAFIKGEYILMQEPERYVNHSCEPNTKSKNFCDIVIRDIKKGEEITSDYSNQLEPNVSMKCNCKSKNCRKIIYPQ